jgi:Tol biopolymer transport system component
VLPKFAANRQRRFASTAVAALLGVGVATTNLAVGTAVGSSAGLDSLADLKVVLAARQRDTRGVPEGMQQLYTSKGDGTNLVRFSPLGNSVYYDWPVWAMNGTKIIFTARPTIEDLGLDGIYMSNPDGSDVTTLVSTDWPIGQPKLSPDGQHLLFSASWPQFPGAALYALSLRTGLINGLTAKTTRAVHEADGRWSADGWTIFFAGQGEEIDGLRPTQLMSVNSGGEDRQRVTNDRWFNVDPMLSPDGRSLAYSSYRGDGHPAGLAPGQTLAPDVNLSALHVHLDQWQLIVQDTQTRTQRSLTRGENCLERGWWQPCEPSEGPAWVPVWLPDGQSIAYISARSGIDTGLYVIGADGSSPRSVVESRELVMNWHDWARADPGAVTSRSITPPSPDRTMLSGGVVHELDLGTGADIPTLELIVSTPDLWSRQRLQPMDASGRALTPRFARWSPDKTHILFAAPAAVPATGVKDDQSSAEQTPAPVELDQVFIMNADGSQVRQLTLPTTEDALEPLAEGELRNNTDPDLSPDGRYVIFTSSASNGQAALMRMDTISGEVVNLSSLTSGNWPGADLRARFSPDGKRIVFASVVDTTQVFVMSVDGGEFRGVSNDLRDDTDPAWSPDGNWIVFVSLGADRDDNDSDATRDSGNSLVKVNLETGARVVLARTTSQISQPIWSPDGESIICIALPAVDAVDAFAESNIYQVSAEDGELRPLAITLRTNEAFVDWR